MIREVAIEDIWDGRFYGAEDEAPVGCGDCSGCSDCCRMTGDSIVLDPLDMYRLTGGLGRTFEDMIEKEIEIRIVDGMILPNIMEHDETNPSREDGCPFLDKNGRCGIHEIRPGFCRLFPLGRYYRDEDRSFRYFVQKGECTKGGSSMVKVCDWIGVPEEEKERYEAYINTWHFFLKDVSARLDMLTDRSRDQVTRYVLQLFYVMPYQAGMDFYAQFEGRMRKAREALKPLLG
ncbi:MAG: YkgJ family cysteine cluster protein [Bilifractor sp.]|jgi:Fe-S-cluster containining protein|nr:YkgJ family cysteine cluster protein [Lachnospiraceae bacterium]MDY2837391.1 YkgJ family cysteine cluster protein [Bilifractor sp.]